MKRLITGIIASCALVAALPAAGHAHCDSMDGPVVKAAQRALATGDVAHALIWVKAGEEAEIRAAFAKTLAVRKLGRDAEEMADRWFFETLVRVHRAGEGEPFTGLKPAGYYKDPAYGAAEMALETASLAPTSPLVEHISHKLHELHATVVKAKNFAASDEGAGREYVRRYTAFMHFVEQLSHLSSDPKHDQVSAHDRR